MESEDTLQHDGMHITDVQLNMSCVEEVCSGIVGLSVQVVQYGEALQCRFDLAVEPALKTNCLLITLSATCFCKTCQLKTGLTASCAMDETPESHESFTVYLMILIMLLPVAESVRFYIHFDIILE